MAVPPLLAGAPKVTVAWPLPGEAEATVGALGATGTATVCVAPALKAAGEALPTLSEMPLAPLRLSLRVPLPVMPVMLTSKEMPEAVKTLAMVPLADPVEASAKSLANTLETCLLKVTVNSMLASPGAGEPLKAMLLTAGTRVSTVALAVSAVVVDPLPFVAVTLTFLLVP